MTIADNSSNYSFRRNFFSGFRFNKAKGSTPKQTYTQPNLPTTFTPPIPRQAHNPAVHPLLAKPVAREENFVLLPIRNASTKRKRDPNSPTRVSIKPKAVEPGMSEWNRYLSSYADGRFNMSNPPEPPATRPSGHLKAPIPSNDNDRALRQYYDVVRPSDPSSLPESPTTRTEIDRFQRIVVTARKTFGTKISLLSLVDEKRQFFKCEAGLGMNVETDREITFCGHTILSNEPMVVLNADKDWRLAENPLVTGWPYVRFYAGAPIITSEGFAIGTVCIIDTEPRESFDINERRKLTEFARLAMDEIDLAMHTRRAKERSTGEPTRPSDPSQAVPAGLRGMTAVASEAGTINATIAGKDIKKAIEGMDDFDVVESNITLEDKRDSAQLKFKYGRNSTAEIERGARGVEKATRKVSCARRPGKAVRVTYPTSSNRMSSPSSPSRKISESYTSDVDTIDKSKNDVSEAEIKPPIRPKSTLRTTSGASLPRGDPKTFVSDSEKENEPQEQDYDPMASSLGHDPPTSIDEKIRASKNPVIARTPAMPTEFDLQTKSNPELAAQLIARALRVDFVYFMRLTPITAKTPNRTLYPDVQVNLELLGCYGLPFPTISFSPYTHLEALRSELGMQYYSEGFSSDTNRAKDYFKVGIVLPVWREYPRSSLTSSTGATSIRARAGSPRTSISGRRSIGESSAATSTTISSLREGCKKGVVVGVFSRREERNDFTRIEREYLKEWVSLRDHL